MPRLKAYNETTSQWEDVVVGGQGPVGPQGPSGTVSVTSPITNSGTSTSANIGLDYSTLQYGRNQIINGGFDIWQRGTSFSGIVFGPDRWVLNASGATVSRNESNPLPGTRYHSRISATSANAYANHIYVMETSDCGSLRGNTITVSARIRRNSIMNAAIGLTVSINSTVDANWTAAGWSNLASTTVANGNITTGTGVNDWTEIKVTTTIPSNGTANTIRVTIGESIAMPKDAIWELSAVQLEVGADATPFKRNSPSLQAELAACQRYFFQSPFRAVDNGYNEGLNDFGGGTYINFPVTMRVAPSLSVSFVSVDNAINLGQTGLTSMGFFQKARRSGASWPYYMYYITFSASAEL